MPILPASFAVEAAEAALHDCIGRGFHVAVAVVDRSGSLRVLIADEHVRDIDIDSARRKAHTAAVLDSATAAIADAVDHVPAYGRLLTDLDSTLIFVGGGLPIHAGHDLVGGIAVGGAPGGNQDAACAGVGIDAIAARAEVGALRTRARPPGGATNSLFRAAPHP